MSVKKFGMFCLLASCLFFGKNTKSDGFEYWSISKQLFDHICTILPEGSTILELGSGWASGEFSKHYTVYSIEHDRYWLGKYDTNYIYAPIKNRWYDSNVLKKSLPVHYDLILVDGPPELIGREGFYTFLNLFDTSAIIIFDDIHRKKDRDLMIAVAQKLERPYKVYGRPEKLYAVIF